MTIMDRKQDIVEFIYYNFCRKKGANSPLLFHIHPTESAGQHSQARGVPQALQTLSASLLNVKTKGLLFIGSKL